MTTPAHIHPSHSPRRVGEDPRRSVRQTIYAEHILKEDCAQYFTRPARSVQRRSAPNKSSCLLMIRLSLLVLIAPLPAQKRCSRADTDRLAVLFVERIRNPTAVGIGAAADHLTVHAGKEAAAVGPRRARHAANGSNDDTPDRSQSNVTLPCRRRVQRGHGSRAGQHRDDRVQAR